MYDKNKVVTLTTVSQLLVVDRCRLLHTWWHGTTFISLEINFRFKIYKYIQCQRKDAKMKVLEIWYKTEFWIKVSIKNVKRDKNDTMYELKDGKRDKNDTMNWKMGKLKYLINLKIKLFYLFRI